MKKNLLTLFIFLNVIGLVYAYDFKEIVFGNNYNNMQEIDCYSEKGQSILNEIYAQVDAVDKIFDGPNWNVEILRKYDSNIDIGTPRLYLFEESYSNGKIWRILAQLNDIKDSSYPSFYELDMYVFVQIVFLKTSDKLICLGCSPIFHQFDDGERSSLDSNEYIGIDVIHRNNKIIGIMQHRTAEKRAYYSEKSEDYETSGKSAAWFVFYENILSKNYNLSSPDRNFIKKNFDFKIIGSYALIDSERPFMYTINNAFDGKNATSFVEDTEDDKLDFAFEFNDKSIMITKIKIINGYAQNEKLYLNNNRVKSISNNKNGKNIILKDNILDYQIIDYNSFNVYVAELYNGNKYSDTCIAEFDVMTTNNAWVFE